MSMSEISSNFYRGIRSTLQNSVTNSAFFSGGFLITHILNREFQTGSSDLKDSKITKISSFVISSLFGFGLTKILTQKKFSTSLLDKTSLGTLWIIGSLMGIKAATDLSFITWQQNI